MLLYRIRNKPTIHADSYAFYVVAPDLPAALKLLPASLGGDFVIPSEVELLTDVPLIDPQYLAGR